VLRHHGTGSTIAPDSNATLCIGLYIKASRQKTENYISHKKVLIA
jgi:hypothetical protein